MPNPSPTPRQHFNSRPSARGDILQAVTFHASPHFNSRPSARGDATHTVAASRHKNFNSRPSARGDIPPCIRITDAVVISIHAPPRGATSALSQPFSPPAFQFTPLREGRRCRREAGIASNLFQFTPLREGRRIRFKSTIFPSRISIHAPPRGATMLDLADAAGLDISIHAPPRGATPRLGSILSALLHFNSRPSARGDSKRYAISANLLFNPYKSAWLNNNATQFVEIILVIFHRIIA